MRKTIILYGASLAALTAILELIEYRFFVRDISHELYIGLVTFLSAALLQTGELRIPTPAC